MKPPPEQLADELLVMRCQDGEADALAELVSRWQRRLWRHAYRMTGREEAAWEVAQEAWLGIVRGLSRLGDPRLFGAWAYRIVSRKAADWVRRRRRLRESQHELDAESQPARDDPGGRDDDDLRAALRRLPAHQRAILSLHYLEELSVAEVAAVLSIPAGTVKSRLHTARNEMKRIWEARQPKPGR